LSDNFDPHASGRRCGAEQRGIPESIVIITQLTHKMDTFFIAFINAISPSDIRVMGANTLPQVSMLSLMDIG
jgi:hypothetical protein